MVSDFISQEEKNVKGKVRFTKKSEAVAEAMSVDNSNSFANEILLIELNNVGKA